MVTTLSSSKTIADGLALPFELVPSKHVTILVLKGRLGVQQARPLWDCLHSSLGYGTSVELDADALDGMDTSIVQILCRAAMEKNPLRIGRVSESFTNALKLRGLENYFAPLSQPPQTADHVVPTDRTKTSNQTRKKRKPNA
jgi:ABC-type transporter Mla MlaB component